MYASMYNTSEIVHARMHIHFVNVIVYITAILAFHCVHALPFIDKCSSNEFGCGDGSCIFSDNICNRFSDCNDGTDELNCHQWSVPSCRSIQYKCLSGGCVSTSKLCDGTDDCADGSDELNCSNVCKCVFYLMINK